MLSQLIVNLNHSLIKLLALFVTFVYSDTMGLFLGMPFLLGKFSGVDLFFSQIIKWSVGNEFGIVTFSTNVFLNLMFQKYILIHLFQPLETFLLQLLPFHQP